jgi:hypothetical protein
MKKLLTALCLLLGCLVHAGAMTPSPSRETTVSGCVRDGGDNSPLEQATVRLITLPDSSLVGGTVSAPDGSFALRTARSGKCVVTVSFVGFDTYYKTIDLPAPDHTLRLGDIRLSEEAYALSEATVTAKAAEVVVKEDTVEYHAGAYKVGPGAVVEDLIKRLPGIEIDADGNVTSGGKAITQILVDGKEFFGKDVGVALKNINVEMLDKLQVIDRKSEEARITGVDDGEEEKVINLTVKKELKKGWFGNLSAAGGNKGRYEGRAMANRFYGDNQTSLVASAGNTASGSAGGETTSRSLGANIDYTLPRGMNLSGGLNVGRNDYSSVRHTDRENILTVPTYYDALARSGSRARSADLNLRFEWKIDSLTQLQVVPSVNLGRTKAESYSTFATTRADSTTVNSGDDSKESTADALSYSTRIVLSRSYAAKKGRKTSLTLTLSGDINDTEATQHALTRYGDVRTDAAVRDTLIDQRQTNRTDRRNLRLRLTHVEPFGKGHFAQLAYAVGRNRSEAESYAYNRDGDAFSSVIDSAYSDRLVNTFVTQRLSAGVRTVRRRYRYEVGVAVEPSSNRVENLLDSTRTIRRTLVNYGPTADATYIWSKHRTLRLQYRGRTQQPSLSQLQSARNVSNPLVVRLGNPDLAPSYQSHLSLRYADYDRRAQRTIQCSLQGRFVTNSIVSRTTVDEATGVQTTRPVNVGGTWSVEANSLLNSPLTPDKRLQVNNDLAASYAQQPGFTNGVKNFARTTSMTETFGVRYTAGPVELDLRLRYALTNTANTYATSQNRLVMSYGSTLNCQLNLPHDVTVGSDLGYRGKHGYSAAVARNEWIWNAQATVSFLRRKQAFAFVRGYDLLHQRSALSHRATTTYVEDVTTNLLTDYFLVGVNYRF